LTELPDLIVEQCTTGEAWNNALNSLPDFFGKAYYEFAYFKLSHANHEGLPTALIFSEKDKVVAFYPFLLKAIPAVYGLGEMFDIETPYGYGGPYLRNPDQKAISAFQQSFASWCSNNSIVAEFIRFNPFIENHRFCENFARISKNRTTVSIDTSSGLPQILKGCTSAKRRNFNNAVKSGLQISDCSLEEFRLLYRKTMNELRADEYYFFSDAYFAEIQRQCPHNFVIKAARTADGKTAAAGIFLKDSLSYHYHLGCSESSLLHLRPNDYLMLKVAEEANKSGKSILHLGGGLNDKAEDGLFRYKKGFSEQTHDFFIGRKIYRPEIYDNISANWQKLTGKQPEILLHYHYGV
jgi:lipid II:glycine glycyltransferase (peptidoglycan interpeptide bridge formation enzyme)